MVSLSEGPSRERTSRTIAIVAAALAGAALIGLAIVAVVAGGSETSTGAPVAADAPTTTAAVSTTSPPTTARATTTTPASAAPATTTAGPTSTSTTAGPTSTSTTAAPATTNPTLAPVGELEAGLFCRDLDALGYDYATAVAYWTREGSPDRMDADRNGIPCETVYPAADVIAFWGEPLPTTLPTRTMEGLEAYVGEEWLGVAGYPIDWRCRLDLGRELIAGAVASCRPAVIGEGEYPVLTALILDDSGTVAVTEAGLRFLELNPGMIVDEYGSGLFCRDVLDADTGLPRWIDDPELEYFGALLYWFMEDRPDRMDADRNGIPCETLVAAAVVDAVWEGGWVGGE